MDWLQLFLMLNVFLTGGLAAVAAQHAYAHFRPARPAKKPQPAEARVQLTAEARERLQKDSEHRFQTILDHAAAELQQGLQSTSNQLNKTLEKLGTVVVGNEMERYRLQLEQIRRQAEQAISGAQDEISRHQADLQAEMEKARAAMTAQLAEDIAAQKQAAVQQILAEKQQLLQQIDTRLADAMASFLLETLGHEVDLGTQTKYLVATLEQHKDDFKQEVASDARPTAKA